MILRAMRSRAITGLLGGPLVVVLVVGGEKIMAPAGTRRNGEPGLHDCAKRLNLGAMEKA
jgi:hypothetical protein